MSEIKREDAYFVEVDQNGCDRCGCSRTYCVVGPDGVAGSTSYEDEEDADAMADALNEAFHQGRSDFDRLQQERDTLARRVTWQPIETAPKDGKIDILGKMWAPAFDEFVYQRFPDCFWLGEDTMTNRKGDWCGIAKHWRAVAWMPIPEPIPPAPPVTGGPHE